MKTGTTMNIRAVVLCSALLIATPVWARQKTDVIVMNNGDRITGEIKELDQGVLHVSLDYASGNLALDWSKVARLESNQLFIIKIQGGSVYTGSLQMVATPAGRPVQIQEVEPPKKELAIESSRVVQVTETSEKFWQRFN